MKLIDFETHFYSESLFEALCLRTEYPFCENRSKIYFTDDFGGIPAAPIIFIHTDEHVKARLKNMDACGISTQVLGVGQGVEELPVSESIACAKATNDLIYRVSKEHPGRFICFGTFPVGDIKAAIMEMERCKYELGFSGWMTFSQLSSLIH